MCLQPICLPSPLVVTTFPVTFLFAPLAVFFFLVGFYIYSKESFFPLVASILLVKYCAIFPHIFLVNSLELLQYILILVVFDFTMEGYIFFYELYSLHIV